MGTPLRNPPVYFTLAQVKFNPILKLDEFVPTIQEAFRRAGYPDFAAHAVTTFKISMLTPEPQMVNSYSFGDSAKTHSFVLARDSLTLQSTDYGTFNSFCEKFGGGLKMVHDAVQLDFVARIGLRYLDRIAPLGEDRLEQYLRPQVLGIRDLIGGAPLHSYCETLTQISGARLLSRVFIHAGPLGFPPDIGQTGLQLQERFNVPPGLHAVLDTDGFVEQRIPFSIEAVRNHLHELHERVGDVFKALATPYAFDMWNKQ